MPTPRSPSYRRTTTSSFSAPQKSDAGAQQQAILDVTGEIYGDTATVRLFGSRADDSARGGDIDLPIETQLSYDEAVSRKIRFLVGLAKRLGDRRVDVVVSSPDSPERSIVKLADETGVLIS